MGLGDVAFELIQYPYVYAKSSLHVLILCPQCLQTNTIQEVLLKNRITLGQRLYVAQDCVSVYFQH